MVVAAEPVGCVETPVRKGAGSSPAYSLLHTRECSETYTRAAAPAK